jgi:catalase
MGGCTVDFEQPRALWSKVFDETAKAHYVGNVAGHLGGVKSAEIKARQRMSHCDSRFPMYSLTHNLSTTVSVFAAVDQGLSDRIAKAIGHPSVSPLKVRPASEAIRFRHGIKHA